MVNVADNITIVAESIHDLQEKGNMLVEMLKNIKIKVKAEQFGFLAINADKTEIIINGVKINRSKSVKLLGCYLQEDMGCDETLKEVDEKVQRKLSKLKIISKYIH